MSSPYTLHKQLPNFCANIKHFFQAYDNIVFCKVCKLIKILLKVNGFTEMNVCGAPC